MAATLLDETEHHAQPQPRALAVGFGGEKRLEGLREYLRRHADSRVSHTDLHIVPGHNTFACAKRAIEADVVGAEVDGAFALHRIAGVDRQVEDGVFQLIAVDEHRPAINGGGHVDLDGFPQRTLQQFAEAVEDLLWRTSRRGQRLAARESQ
ncbi:hypothetical protein D3C87_1320310 [compost metagenome]